MAIVIVVVVVALVVVVAVFVVLVFACHRCRRSHDQPAAVLPMPCTFDPSTLEFQRTHSYTEQNHLADVTEPSLTVVRFISSLQYGSCNCLTYV